jgi:hypothetical protein
MSNNNNSLELKKARKKFEISLKKQYPDCPLDIIRKIEAGYYDYIAEKLDQGYGLAMVKINGDEIDIQYLTISQKQKSEPKEGVK